MCPVAALRNYIGATSRSACQSLWVGPGSILPISAEDIATRLVRLIRLAGPFSDPEAHQVGMYASSLAFFRSFDVEAVRLAGHWSS